MKEQSRVTPSRITLARMRRGLLKWQLARGLELRNARPVYDWESGRVEPSPEMLQRLGDVLRFPVGFFYQPHIEMPVLPPWE